MKFPVLIALIGLVSLTTSAQADVSSTKLTCELDVIVHHPYGEPSNSHETTGVELQIDESTGFRAVLVDSMTIPVSVANSKGGAITAFVDNSDDNRWDLSTDRKRAGSLLQQYVAIDRNTGRLNAFSISTVGNVSERTEARGVCSKVDTVKRKF
jgi:hypothetical protein